MSTTLVCDEKIYQSGQNVRQLLLDKRFSAESESICSKTQTLEPHQSLVIPTCSFVHVHSNKELVFDFNVEGNITTRRGSFVTCGFEYDEVTVTNPSKESAIVYMVYQIPFQYKAPEIEMVVEPSAGTTIEMGQELEQVVFDITAIRGTRDIEAIKVYRDNLLIYSKSDVVTSQHFNFTYKPKTPIVESTKFKLVVTDGKTAVEQEVEYYFRYPLYYGEVQSNPVDVEEVAHLPSMYLDKQDFSLIYNVNEAYVCCAIPTEWGRLRLIEDPNGFNVTESFDVQELMLPLGTVEKSFYVYVLKTITLIENYEFHFKF